MCETFERLDLMLGAAAETAGDLPYSADLGWSEPVHAQERRTLSILLLNLQGSAQARSLGEGAGPEGGIPRTDAGQLDEIQRLLGLAQSEEATAPERWAALEELMAGAKALLA